MYFDNLDICLIKTCVGHSKSTYWIFILCQRLYFTFIFEGSLAEYRILCWPFISVFSSLNLSSVLICFWWEVVHHFYVFACLYCVFPFDGFICFSSLVFSRLVIRLGMFFFVWGLLNLLNLYWCLPLIMGIFLWLLALQLFLLFHTPSPILSFWESSYMYIRLFDFILQISGGFPSILFPFCF